MRTFYYWDKRRVIEGRLDLVYRLCTYCHQPAKRCPHSLSQFYTAIQEGST